MSYYCEKCKEQRTQGCFGPRCPGIPKHAGGDSLPALPPPDRTMWQHGKQIDHYTDEQMRAYASAALGLDKYVARVTDCEGCLTQDACVIRGQCAHYLRERGGA